VRKAKASSPKRDFDTLRFEDSESVDDFSVRIGRITTELAGLGEEHTEEEIVRKFLQALPPRFDQIAASIETLLDLSEVSVDELVGRLKAAEERLVKERGVVAPRLNLTEDELISKIASCLKVAGEGGSNNIKHPSLSGNAHGRGRSRGRGRGQNAGRRGGGNTGRGGRSIANDECRYCGITGHWARECRKKKRGEQVHAMQADVQVEEAAALLLADASIDGDVVTQPRDVTSGATTPPEVHLKEDKLFMQLGDKAVADARWVLDTGVTNHMTSDNTVFSSLDTDVHGTVRFGDGSVTTIQGRGTILLKCRNGAHHVLAGVYLVPRLTTNIVSLGQLEEDDHKILLLHGRLKIWDVKGQLVANVARAANRLYVLELVVARPICLMAQGDSAA
jgi:hypothetical protein